MTGSFEITNAGEADLTIGFGVVDPELEITGDTASALPGGATRSFDVSVDTSGFEGGPWSIGFDVLTNGVSGGYRGEAGNDLVLLIDFNLAGTRSAMFAPCRQLGLICVDEEQETSYKNLQAPRFHVRDTAIMRAQQLGIPVVLGSATPSLDTWHNCERRPHYKRIDLTDAADRQVKTY